MAEYFDFTKDMIVKGKYSNGNTALSVIDDDGLPIAKLTTNIEDINLKDGEVIIKNYSENEGVLQDLIDMGIVNEPHLIIPSRFVEFNICKLNM